MIPYRLKFAGIRDFKPTSMDLSGDGHVMIAGPNGSGKSTLTYCMGAVLNSAKVDIEGLKSRNLPPEKLWKAHVSLLFKNEGRMKLDEPTYIQFTINIVQEPGEPVKKEFIVEKGETIDEWEETVKYTSGDRYYNFTAYNKDLQFRYKIDPDLFYLIWYQQEVNQFAVMDPEGRFRIFSEMHGIDQMQKNWEEAIEKVKETEETLRSAEININNHKHNLNLLKAKFDQFVDNQKRLRKGAKESIAALLNLEQLYKKEIKTLEDILNDLKSQLEEKRDESVGVSLKKEDAQQELGQLENNEKQLEQVINELTEQIDKEKNNLKEISAEKVQLETELEGLIERQKKIERTEEEAQEEFRRLTEKLAHIETKLSVTDKEIVAKKEKQEGLVGEAAKLNAQIEQDEIQEKMHQERLKQFESSHKVQQTIDRISNEINKNNDLLHDVTSNLEKLKDEEQALKEDRSISERQRESIQYFSQNGIKAFPLRELIELDETAKLSDENKFNAIKYTIFFNSKTANPPNDLYHVSLMEIIPDRFADHMPEIHLKVKDNLSDEHYNFAVKALYWVGKFFQQNEPTIKNGVLKDVRGLRGPQEKDTYILSRKAILKRIEEVRLEIDKLSQKKDELAKQIQKDTEQFQILNSEIQKVRESEAFMTKRFEREQRKEKLKKVKAEEQQVKELLQQLEMKRKDLVNQKVEHDYVLEIIKNELDFYKELGKSKEKYERLYELTNLEKDKKQEINLLDTNYENSEDELNKLKQKIKNVNRQIDTYEQDMEDIERDKVSIERQQKKYQEQKETYENELVNVIQQLEDLNNLVSDLYSEFTKEFEAVEDISETALKNKLESGRITFNNARNEQGIDPAAKENYEKAKEEFERLENEYNQSKLLLEADIERTEELKHNLETTINMRVLEINNRFVVYMGHFQFEGNISWESYEDKKGRTHFQLFIKARKEGHRGSMEDVSVKARGGKVGKGVSGGEESLSSLLFALSLLQNIEISPGFIVLDEFDSALDEHRKAKVFDLYANELQRKLIILTPKTHEDEYINKFNKAFIVQHDPTIPESKVTGIYLKNKLQQV